MVTLNDFNGEAELDYALENRSTYSMNHSDKSKSNDEEINNDDESINSYSSYDSES